MRSMAAARGGYKPPHYDVEIFPFFFLSLSTFSFWGFDCLLPEILFMYTSIRASGFRYRRKQAFGGLLLNCLSDSETVYSNE